MTGEGYILQAYKHNFSTLNPRKLGIYGLGDGTKDLIRAYSTGYFGAMIDWTRTGEEFMGYPVMSIEDALECGIEYIIIVARPNNVKVIFCRIKDICERKKIRVFDINGENLSIKAVTDGKNKVLYGRYTEAGLKKILSEHSIISFDVFDTLLVRDVLFDEDIFEILERYCESDLGIECDLKKNRVKAELILNTKKQVPQFQEIYAKVKQLTGLTDDHIEKIMSVEIELEKKHIKPRKYMLDLYNRILDMAKTVYCVSNMYFSKEVLEDLLIANGFSSFEKVFVSSDYGMDKEHGLYDLLLNDIPAGASVLHIGDNDIADIQAASNVGIHAFKVKSVCEMAGSTFLNDIAESSKHVLDRFIVKKVYNRLFDNPFILEQADGKIQIRSDYELGYCCIAPLFAKYTQWMYNRLRNEKDALVLFAARDGYLPLKLFKKLSENSGIEPVYFNISRMIAVKAGLRNEEDISLAVQLAFSGSTADMLRNRFGVEITEHDKTDRNQISREAEVLEYKDEILKTSSVFRERYQRYINQFSLVQYKNLFFVDFVSSGTCQMYLENILDRTLKGMYFIRLHEDNCRKKELAISSMADMQNIYRTNSFVSESFEFLEKVMTSFEGSAVDIDCAGNIILENEQRDMAELNSLKEIHRGIEEFFDSLIAEGMIFSMYEISYDTADRLYEILKQTNSDCELEFVQQGEVYDGFCNRKINGTSSLIW